MRRTDQSITGRTPDRPSGRRYRAGPGHRREGRGTRAANALDRYSLFLQLIQVFPVVSAVVIIIVPRAWVARGLACLGLLLVTLWVIRIERANGARERRARNGGRPGPTPEGENRDVVTAAVVPVQVARDEPVVTAPVFAGVVRAEVPCGGREITISILLHPPSTEERSAGAEPDGP